MGSTGLKKKMIEIRIWFMYTFQTRPGSLKISQRVKINNYSFNPRGNPDLKRKQHDHNYGTTYCFNFL